MTDVTKHFERAVAEFTRRVQAVTDDRWNAPTPCSDWDVRKLLQHVVYETKWTAPLLEGKTIQEVGDVFEGDLLGDDPKAAWASAVEDASRAVNEDGSQDRTVHLSFGDFPGSEYISQVLSDFTIHSWDLARAIGADDRLDDELVEYVYSFLEPQAEAWRAAGAFADAVEVAEDADAQTKLLALTGRRG